MKKIIQLTIEVETDRETVAKILQEVSETVMHLTGKRVGVLAEVQESRHQPEKISEK